MTGLVRVEAEGHLGALTLTDPDRLNALSPQMLEEIRAAASWLDAQPGVSVVIVSGAGRAFSAGFDLPSLAAFDQLDSDAQRDAALLGGLVADAVESMRAVTVAQLHGWVVGGGVVLAAACDLRYAGAHTRFRIPEVAMGLPLGWGGIPRLSRLVGPARAKEWVMTGREFDASEAMSNGLVNHVVPDGELASRVEAEANHLASMPQQALLATKRAMAEVGPEDDGNEALLEALRSDAFRVARDRYLGRQ